jgi:hypothetical protein
MFSFCEDIFQQVGEKGYVSLSERVKPTEEECWERDGIVDEVLNQAVNNLYKYYVSGHHPASNRIQFPKRVFK